MWTNLTIFALKIEFGCFYEWMKIGVERGKFGKYAHFSFQYKIVKHIIKVSKKRALGSFAPVFFYLEPNMKTSIYFFKNRKKQTDTHTDKKN